MPEIEGATPATDPKPDEPKVDTDIMDKGEGVVPPEPPPSTGGANTDSEPHSEEPSPETPPPSAEDVFLARLTRKEQVEYHQAAAIRIIEIAKENGVYDTPEKTALADKALASGGKDIKTVLAVLERTQGEGLINADLEKLSDEDKAKLTDEDKAKMIQEALANVNRRYSEISQNTRLTMDGETYDLTVLLTERETADDARKAEINAILDKGEYRLSFVDDRAAVEIDKKVVELRKEIESAKKSGTNVETRQKILELLVYAQEMDGPGGIFLKERALTQLSTIPGIEVDKEVLTDLRAEVPQSEREMFDVLTIETGMSSEDARSFINALRAGDVKPLIEKGWFKKTGMEKLFYGRERTDKEWEATLKKVFEGDPRYQDMKDYLLTHKKQMGMMLLMLLYMGMTSEQVKKLIGLP
ncbi:MAG: hypothetical protein UU67_C0076G0003 [Candidatus Daviesbacteria bacterium GW2011_GWB1_41_5]|uniref:Uncharacterized protein n=1 Tax=Candidatus Daviesbacteria bacterium GW2011_GWB1_41_5 TaxID=1618429 RepID=A0A0G0WH01_9BACT|nr:MAG: hypothetical protein UU67_C0076G0003 [Candidatus Daviesbacteria bacterium GW2011_GWB1_41_5]